LATNQRLLEIASRSHVGEVGTCGSAWRRGELVMQRTLSAIWITSWTTRM